MSIGPVGSSNNPLVSALQATGLSADKIRIVEEDLDEAQQSAGASAGKGVDAAAVRQALDTQIAEDVVSGKLSQEDADKIGKALDEMEGKSSGSVGASGAAKAGGGRPAGGGGGGGGSTEKTELSRAETVAGGIKTTVITYTDGTTETETSFVAEADSKATPDSGKAEKPSASEQTAQDYLAQVEPGSLFDAYA